MTSDRDRARVDGFAGKLEAFAAALSPVEQTWLLSICAAACSTLDPDAVAGYGVGPFGPHSPPPSGISVQQLATIFAANDGQ